MVCLSNILTIPPSHSLDALYNTNVKSIYVKNWTLFNMELYKISRFDFIYCLTHI